MCSALQKESKPPPNSGARNTYCKYTWLAYIKRINVHYIRAMTNN